MSVLPDLERELVQAAARAVPSGAAELPEENAARASIRTRPRRRRTVRWLVPSVPVAAAFAIVIALLLSPGPSPSIVARAYAAINSVGSILSYKTTEYSPGIDKPNDYSARFSATYAVWVSGDEVRLVGTVSEGGQPGHPASPSDSREVVIDGTHITSWDSSREAPGGVVTKTTNDQAKGACTSILALTSPGCGPLTAVRQVYRSGILHAAGQTTDNGNKVDVLTGTEPGAPVTAPRFPPIPRVLVRVLVDAITFTPVEVQVTSGPGTATTMTFEDLKRLPLTAANKKLLQMSPHPGACVTYVPARGIVLKSGARLPCR